MMHRFIQQCWSDFLQKKNLQITNKTPIPILWFGNYDEYRESKVKVLTVGLNPSSMEFKATRNSANWDVCVRFPKAVPLVNKQNLTQSDLDAYKAAMSEYFTNGTEYWNWFTFNERILKALGASYKMHDYNRALHIDIYTPIATDPTWGKLDGIYRNQKQQLLQHCGYDFQQFVDFLKPDVIIVSANASEVSKYFQNDRNCPCTKANSDACIPNCNGQYNPYIRGYKLQNNRKLIWVKNCNGKPLQDIPDEKEVISRVQSVYSKL